MKVKEAAQNLVKHFEQAIGGSSDVTSAVSKQYLESVRGHYLSALAGLSTGKQEQSKIIHNVGSFSALEDNDSERVAEAGQTSMQGLLDQGQSFTEIGMQIHLSKGVMGTPDKKLQAIKVQLNKTLAKNNEEQVREMIGKVGDFGPELETMASELEVNRGFLSEPGVPKESLLKGGAEGGSIQWKVKSLKAELENLKKEHAELKDKGAGPEFPAGSLRFKLLRSKSEDEGCIVNQAKVAAQDQQAEDQEIKGKGLKRELESSKVPVSGQKKSRIALDVDEAKEPKTLIRNGSLPGRTYPACVSTSESSARKVIPEDELEASSLKEEKSDKHERGQLASLTERLEPEKYDFASEFSIRDFVFAARNKDISINWPFSQKNLQLCLKHGVKDLLPPFQPIDSLRDSSRKRYVAETRCNSEESNLDNRPVLLKNHPSTRTSKDHRWNQELGEGYRDSDSFPSGGEKDLAFKTTATANSEVESVSTSNLPLSEVSDERVAAASAVNDKAKSSTSQLSDKKSQLPAKMRTSSCRSAAEDITSACTVPCEPMTSKICPVCEAFSSSSNTTLNAHIDQCLSSQSTLNWANPKLLKPRVKPRKIRLMSDICATAPRSTLEDLDRRNGTNWATTADCPTQDTEVAAEGKTHRVSSRYLANNADDGAVYIDSSGRKIRILSKFNDTLSLPLPKAVEDPKSEKQSKKGRTNRFLSSARKRRLAKRLKYLKANRQKKRFSSLKLKGHPKEASGAGEATFVRGEKHAEEQELAGSGKTQEQRSAGVCGSSRPWMSSKGSAWSKKYGPENMNRHCRYELRTTKERQAPKYPSSNGRMHIKKRSGSLKNCVSPQQSSMRTPGLCRPGSDKRSEDSCRKRTLLDDPSLRGPAQRHRESYISPSKPGAPQYSGEFGGVPKSMDSTVTPTSSLEGEDYVQADAVDNVFPDSGKFFDSSHAGPFQRMRSQSPQNNRLSPSLSPVHASRSNSYRKSLSLERPFGFRRNRKGDLRSVDRWGQQSDAVPDHLNSRTSSDSLEHHHGMMKVQAMRGLEVSDDVSKDHIGTDGLQDGNQNRGIYGPVKSTIIGLHDNGEVIAPPVSSSGLSAGETVNLSSPELQKIVDVQDPKSNPLLCSDKFHIPLFRTGARIPPDEAGPRDDHEMLYRNEVGNDALQFETGDSHFRVDREIFFPEVDPIPIPGPPGSDLPSFSDMGSEDLHRNSSLSGCLAQSSGDGDYVGDGDQSDSPLSATSTISNMGVKDDLTVSESLTATIPASSGAYPGWLGGSSEPIVSTSSMFSQFALPGTERFAPMVDNAHASVTAPQGRECCSSQRQGIRWGFQESESHHSGLGKPSAAMLNRTNFQGTTTGSIPVAAVSAEAGVTFPRSSDCDSASPSAPILRLMGKDLMVINKERQDLSRNQAVCTNSQLLPASSGFSSWQRHSSSQRTVFMAPSVLEPDPRVFAMRHFNFGPSNVMSSSSESPKQGSGGTYINKRMHAGGFTVPSSSPLHR